MILPVHLDRPVYRHLFAHYLSIDKAHGEQVRSGFSPFEAQMKMHAMLLDHEPLLVREQLGTNADGTPIEGRVLWEDSGIRCGLIDAGPGDNYPAAPSTFRTHPAPATQRPSLVASALRRIKLRGAPADMRLLHQLELLARNHLKDSRMAFGGPFGAEEGAKNRLLVRLAGVAKEPRRGPGNLAHYTLAAVRVFGDGPVAERELDAVGKHLGEHGRRGAPWEKELCRAIAPQARALVLACLSDLAAEMSASERLPAALRRAG